MRAQVKVRSEAAWAGGTTGVRAQDRSPIIEITFSREFPLRVCLDTRVLVSEGWGCDPAAAGKGCRAQHQTNPAPATQGG